MESPGHRGHSNTLAALIYHDIFDFPLTVKDLKRWETPIKTKKAIKANIEGEYYFLPGRKNIIKSRILRYKYSQTKLKIAKKAATFLEKIPTIKMIGVTGSVSMLNAKQESDIDLLLITTRGALWTTRALTYLVLFLAGFKVRRAGENDEQDKLCLNMWIDESDLSIEYENIYTAHELSQIIPLVNKDNTYERLITCNKWIFRYWPQAANIRTKSILNKPEKFLLIPSGVEELFYKFQASYMQSKKTREVVTKKRAFFHPFDWGQSVMKELQKRGLEI